MSGLSPEAIRHIRGAAELLHDAVDAGARAAAGAQRAIARYPYEALAQFPAIAAPSRAMGRAQHALTDRVYRAIHEVNALARTTTSAALDAAERQQKKRGRSA